MNRNDETANMVASTLRGLLNDESTDEENQLACSLLQNMASQIGLDVEHTPEIEDEICTRLLEQFRNGRFDLVAMGKQVLVVDKGGKVLCRLKD
jgi:hypothetical protein